MKNIENAIQRHSTGNTVVIMSNNDRKEYYFSSRHVMTDDKGNLLDYQDFVPCTYLIPNTVVPRPSLPDGIVDTVAKMLMIFHYDEVEIENPYPQYRIKEG